MTGGRQKTENNRLKPINKTINLSQALSTSVVSPLPPSIAKLIEAVVYAKADSGASDHYVREEDEKILTSLHDVISKPITLPNDKTIQATLVGTLLFAAKLSEYTRRTKLLPELKSTSLVSLRIYGMTDAIFI